MAAIVYKIGLVGPTRVGKTTLVSSVLADSQKFLAGTPVKFVPEGPTRARVHANTEDLNGALTAGAFNPGALAGSEGRTDYELSLEVPKSQLSVRILDYPGGWLTQSPPEFKAVRDWFAESSVLVVPIDAVVAMECASASQRSAANRRLNIAAVAEAAQDWAKSRVSKGEPGTLLLVPVKCESYFADNGGRLDRSSELHKRIVQETYQDVLNQVRDEVADRSLVKAYYMPVDTMGCVELVDVDWVPAADGVLECHTTYRVVNGGTRKILGAGDVLVAMSKIIMEAEKTTARGIFSEIWRWFKGTDKALQKAISDLNAREYGPRVKQII